MEGSCFTFYLQDLVHMSLSPQGNKIEYSSSNPFNTYYSVACYVSVTLLGICVGSYQTKASVSVPSAGRGKHTLGIRAGLSRALGNVQGCRMLRTWHEGNTAVAHTGLKTSDPTCEQNAVPSPPRTLSTAAALKARAVHSRPIPGLWCRKLEEGSRSSYKQSERHFTWT